MDWASQLNQRTDREEAVAHDEVNVPKELLPGLLMDKEPPAKLIETILNQILEA